MKRIIFCPILVFAMLLAWVASAPAVGIVVSPATATVGETVTVTVTGEFTSVVTPGAGDFGILRINFGDGSPVEIRQPLPPGFGGPPLAYTFTRTHTFTASGTYTVTGIAAVSGGATAIPPLRATQTITISDAVDAQLPRGEVGLEYEHQLQSLSGARNSYRLVRGKLPPGLELSRNGVISGIPTQKGPFTFTLQITSSQGFASTQQLTLSVDPGNLVIETTPETINLTIGGATSQRVTFTVVFPTVAITETITSSRGEFWAGGQLLGYNPGPLGINLNSAAPSASETITVPQNVLMSAQKAGTNRLAYRRTFKARNLNPGTGESRVTLRSSASGELRITKMRVYFEQNNRPLILVQRNERDLTGMVDIHYNGTGTFKGFWQVDNRIIQRVQQNLFYGKVLTLKTPPVPPLPTYSEGGHRLQFVITEPQTALERIEFPEAIYHVEAKRAQIVVPITLTVPENKAEIGTAGDSFSWTDLPRIATYYIEFFTGDDTDPFFTAYTKKAGYQLTAKLMSLRFTSGNTYRWRVRGFNAAEELAAESAEQSFTITPNAAFVPGQVIFLVDDNEAGRQLITRIVAKYNLQILEQTKLAVLNRIMVLCSTDEEVEHLSAQLEKEEGLYRSQPNFIFNTMNEHDPLRPMQSIHKLLDLERIQQLSSGKNIVVAVIDTGVELDHQDLQGRLKAHWNFIDGSPYQGEIHGTAVAGIIAGERNDFGILGIAPDAELLALRACEQQSATRPDGLCYSSTIAKALDVAIQERANIVNLSLGSAREDKLLSDLLDMAHREGMLLVAPAGNDPQVEQLAFPASHPDVTAVAGLGPDNQPLPNRKIALAADAVAPAKDIFTTSSGNKHNFVDGTSFSAATISGIIALSLEKHNNAAPLSYPHFDESTPWQNQVAAFIGL